VEAGERRIWFEDSMGKKLVISYFKQELDVAYMSVTPARWEVKVGGSQSEATPGKKEENLSEKQLRQKG
jgi:hypothetical protein